MRKIRSDQYFDGIKVGLQDALNWAQGKNSAVTVRDVELPDPPKRRSPRQIAAIRKTKIGASQAVFARLMNASVKTIHAWEQGRGQPSGPALRLLDLLDKHPELVREIGRK
jgi:putative transcriptional regulator